MFPWNKPYNEARLRFNERLRIQSLQPKYSLAQVGSHVLKQSNQENAQENCLFQETNHTSNSKGKDCSQIPTYEMNRQRESQGEFHSQRIQGKLPGLALKEREQNSQVFTPRSENVDMDDAYVNGFEFKDVNEDRDLKTASKKELDNDLIYHKTPPKIQNQPATQISQANIETAKRHYPRQFNQVQLDQINQARHESQPLSLDDGNYASLNYQGRDIDPQNLVLSQNPSDNYIKPSPRTQRIMRREYSNSNNEETLNNQMTPIPNRLPYPQADANLIRQERIRKYSKYQQDLLEQIEEKNKRKAEESERKKLEDQKENERFQRDMADLNQQSRYSSYNRRLLFQSGQKQEGHIQNNQQETETSENETVEPIIDKKPRIKLPRINLKKSEEVVNQKHEAQSNFKEGLEYVKKEWNDHNLNINEQILELKKTILDIQQQKLQSQHEINEIKLQIKSCEIADQIRKENMEISLPKRDQCPSDNFISKKNILQSSLRARRLKPLNILPRSLQNLELSIIHSNQNNQNEAQLENLLDFSLKSDDSELSFMYTKTSSLFLDTQKNQVINREIEEQQDLPIQEEFNQYIEPEKLVSCSQEESFSIDEINKKNDRLLKYLEELETMGLV